MIFLTFIFIGIALIYLAKALREFSDLLSDITGNDDGGEPGQPEPPEPPKLYTLDEVLDE